MRPVLQKNKLSNKLWALYILIFVICTMGIGAALYLQHYQDENIGLVFGITEADSEEEDRYNDLKAEFIDGNLFTNNIEIKQEENLQIEKIRNEYDIVVTAYKYEKNEENSSINVSVPYINVNNNAAKSFNKKIGNEYKKTAEELMNKQMSTNIIYNVEYKAYLQDNIISLAVRSSYKEGNTSQKIVVKTFNYNLKENREVTIDEILNIKGINKKDANKKIKEEIKKIQEQNEALRQALADQSISFFERNYKSDIYDISNSNQFLYGKNGRLYIIYCYGNDAETNEMDVVIFI